MVSNKGIVWLSSYPKSGNTWFRIVLSRLLNPSSNLNYINEMDTILGSFMVASRAWMDKNLGFNSALLSDDEIDELRPDLYQWYAKQRSQTAYIKIHDAYTHLRNNSPLIPTQGSLGALYFVRNPLDVAISLSHHVGCPIDWSIHMMGDEQFAMPLEVNKEKQLRQKLLSWSHHVKSWDNLSAIDVCVLRYEDMFFNPIATFTKALTFLKLDIDTPQLEKAIEDASFKKLQQFEKDVGFRERPAPTRHFFRKGQVDDWKNTLTSQQIDKIIHDHGEVMKKYGYIA